MVDDMNEECPGKCGGHPKRGCWCMDDGEQYRVPRTQWPDGDRANRKVGNGRYTTTISRSLVTDSKPLEDASHYG